MRESELEARLVQGVKAVGGKAYKFVSPGNAGVPDRIVVLPGGRVLFAELKADGGRLSAIQVQRLKELAGFGCDTLVLQGGRDLSWFLDLCSAYIRGGDTA